MRDRRAWIMFTRRVRSYPVLNLCYPCSSVESVVTTAISRINNHCPDPLGLAPWLGRPSWLRGRVIGSGRNGASITFAGRIIKQTAKYEPSHNRGQAVQPLRLLPVVGAPPLPRADQTTCWKSRSEIRS
jgi:hypothetical protein